MRARAGSVSARWPCTHMQAVRTNHCAQPKVIGAEEVQQRGPAAHNQAGPHRACSGPLALVASAEAPLRDPHLLQSAFGSVGDHRIGVPQHRNQDGGGVGIA